MEGSTLLMMKMTPKLSPPPHCNHVAYVSVMLMITIQLALVVGVMANQFCKPFPQSKDHGR
jgi:hypothetical protein